MRLRFLAGEVLFFHESVSVCTALSDEEPNLWFQSTTKHKDCIMEMWKVLGVQHPKQLYSRVLRDDVDQERIWRWAALVDYRLMTSLLKESVWTPKRISSTHGSGTVEQVQGILGMDYQEVNPCQHLQLMQTSTQANLRNETRKV